MYIYTLYCSLLQKNVRVKRTQVLEIEEDVHSQH